MLLSGGCHHQGRDRPAGRALAERAFPKAFEITDKTLEPLSARERKLLMELLVKLR